MFPVHEMGDAIGKHCGERGLIADLTRYDNTLWSGICANKLGASAGITHTAPLTPYDPSHNLCDSLPRKIF